VGYGPAMILELQTAAGGGCVCFVHGAVAFDFPSWVSRGAVRSVAPL
jgi:hypothetical protein